MEQVLILRKSERPANPMYWVCKLDPEMSGCFLKELSAVIASNAEVRLQARIRRYDLFSPQSRKVPHEGFDVLKSWVSVHS
jgi:hypothetical protein